MFYSALNTAVADLGGAFSAERLALAGQMVLIGMGMIFAVLGLLWGVLAMFKIVFARPEPKKKAASAPAEVAPAAELRGRQPTGTARERLRRGWACTCLAPPARLVWTVCRATAGFSSTAVPRGHKVRVAPPEAQLD